MRKKYIESISGGNSDIVSFRDERIEDLFLDFTLPGYPDIVLASGTDHSVVSHYLLFLSFNFQFNHSFNG